MTSEEWHDVLTMLTIVILADRRVYKEEVDTFVSAVQFLNKAISPDMLMTKGMAFDWFKSNKKRVANLLVGSQVDKSIENLIKRTDKIPGQGAILAAMQDIAQADSDFHKNEQNIIEKCALGWGIELPVISPA